MTCDGFEGLGWSCGVRDTKFGFVATGWALGGDESPLSGFCVSHATSKCVQRGDLDRRGCSWVAGSFKFSFF